MLVINDIKEFSDVIQATVAVVLAQQANDASQLGDKLAFSEPEAAALLGLASHQLRDERQRGRITSTSIVGRKIRYTRGDLLAYLARNRIAARV